ncbi:MoaD/ThiS family protein [Dethiosulfatarculus sandiegensis]|uniref:Molybdenum cofactor biosynthesis protein MoaD n=1 Tax=Dethiosulfatarculus sandiegensis TaxID=1429043 RepID=A0A0D2JIP0_9BACT|nr:MoaD/ThiS family protein [Dethiosulfatarculus sandiegensis]KIX15526.1 molybdenum cofactor biosynthesis protein MoaD [Dethiosulfatarculus sandiegensis]
MLIKVKLLLTFKDRAPQKEQPFGLELPPGATVGAAFAALGIKPEEKKVALLNGRVVEPERELSQDDLLTVFPPLEGG